MATIRLPPDFKEFLKLLKFIETRTTILQEASQLPPAARNTIFLGTWTLKDLLAHLAGWDFTNLAAFDILAEFVFHGFFFITVSVIVAVALLIFIGLDAGKSQPQAS
jgi:hypothetical protein